MAMRNFKGINGLAPTLLTSVLTVAAFAQQSEELLPDLFPDAAAMQDYILDVDTLEGRTLLRFTSIIANLGPGELAIESNGQPLEGGYEFVVQRIYEANGNSTTYPLENFAYNPETEKMAPVGWADYRLRKVLPGGDVGDVMADDAKPEVRITSSRVYNDQLPNVPPPGEQIIAQGGFHGISVGYADVYPRGLMFQWIDVTGLKSGDYWLEIEINAAHTILEETHENNFARLMVTLDLGDDDPFGCPSASANGSPPDASTGDRATFAVAVTLMMARKRLRRGREGRASA